MGRRGRCPQKVQGTLSEVRGAVRWLPREKTWPPPTETLPPLMRAGGKALPTDITSWLMGRACHWDPCAARKRGDYCEVWYLLTRYTRSHRRQRNDVGGGARRQCAAGGGVARLNEMSGILCLLRPDQQSAVADSPPTAHLCLRDFSTKQEQRGRRVFSSCWLLWATISSILLTESQLVLQGRENRWFWPVCWSTLPSFAQVGVYLGGCNECFAPPCFSIWYDHVSCLYSSGHRKNKVGSVLYWVKVLTHNIFFF